MEKKLYTITMGALYHDIGKLVQRAGSERLSHSEIGARFLDDERIRLPHKQEIIEIVRYHHMSALQAASLPTNHPAYIVYEADNIAAAADRRPNEGMDRGFVAGVPLQAVFNLIGAFL